MNSTVFTGHENAANMTPQQKHISSYRRITIWLSGVRCRRPVVVELTA